jgi:YggT family protein
VSWLLVAITRDDLAGYVNALFIVYIILVFARILLSWIPRIPYNRTLQAIVDFIHDTTEPYLRIFRRILPPVGGRGFALDLSPIVAIFVLIAAQALIVGLIAD